MDDEIDDVDEEVGSLAILRRMLRTARGRIQNLTKVEAIEVLRRTAEATTQLDIVDHSNPGSEKRVTEVFFSAGKNCSNESTREDAIAAVFQVVKCLKEETLIVDSIVAGTPLWVQINDRIPQGILDVLLIDEILNRVVEEPINDGPVKNSADLRNLYKLGKNFTGASPYVVAAAEEGFIALAESTLDEIELSDNMGFKAMVKYIIQVARTDQTGAVRKEFLDRVTFIVEENQGCRELRQQEAGIKVDAPAFKTRPVPQKNDPPGRISKRRV